MPNTYTQIHVQFVFAVKYREALIQPIWKENLHKYITGIFQENRHKMLQINSMPDHIHILVGSSPHQSISSLIQNVKLKAVNGLKRIISANILLPGKKAMVLFHMGKASFLMSLDIFKIRKNIIKRKVFLMNTRSF